MGPGNDTTPEQIDNTLTKASAPTTRNAYGVHKYAGQTGEEIPAAVDIQIDLQYSVVNKSMPWRYKLTFPTDRDFRKFMQKAGYKSQGYGSYEGDSDDYITADVAKRMAESMAKKIVQRYSAYLAAQHQAKTYTLTIPVTSN